MVGCASLNCVHSEQAPSPKKKRMHTQEQTEESAWTAPTYKSYQKTVADDRRVLGGIGWSRRVEQRQKVYLHTEKSYQIFK